MVRSILKQMIVVCGFLSCLQVASEAKAYYASHQGRFISRDPIGYVDGKNLYIAYFAPNNLDPSGLTGIGLGLPRIFPAGPAFPGEPVILPFPGTPPTPTPVPPYAVPNTVPRPFPPSGTTIGNPTSGLGNTTFDSFPEMPGLPPKVSNWCPKVSPDSGDCSPGKLAMLQENMMRKCYMSGSMKLEAIDLIGIDPCPRIKELINRTLNCVNARNDIMSKCFGGGDQIHRDKSQGVQDTYLAPLLDAARKYGCSFRTTIPGPQA